MRGRLQTMGFEAMAFARQAWLLRHDLGPPVVPEAKAGDDVVVFLHGLLASAGVLRPLRAAVCRHRGVHATALSYAPGPGVEQLSARLGEVVERIPAGVRVHLVGHSLGGVVARHYAHRAPRGSIVQTISLASPFAGIPRAGLLGFGFAKDIDPRSALLRAIRLECGDFPHIPHLSIIAGADAVVPAPVSQALPFGEVAVLEGRGHNTLLFDAEVARIVEARLLARAPRAAPNQGGTPWDRASG